MIVLLPPSENKATRVRGANLHLPELSWSAELTEAREEVLAAVSAVSLSPDAATVLGVSPNLSADIARNTQLSTAPTLPASSLYTGVLYDALHFESLTRGAKVRAARRLIVSSALYGAVRPSDRLAPYRLSMGVNLPPLGPLATFWKRHLQKPMATAAGRGVIVDCRSSTYAASWTPLHEQQARWVHIRVPGATHMAKHTRGLLARHLMEQPKDPTTPQALLEVAQEKFTATLHEPSSTSKPWILDVSTHS